ncbi:hypothetical protein [Bacillus sp. 95MFCvi2.1]|uniref:hypothetical protein n=1 Tax=Bacillus sp. 95MFCvi2.1 TaxID=1151121 RepID=UPI00036378E5|nr:hypothetical protein [Bacillus sp. 95MFCvi2.1]
MKTKIDKRTVVGRWVVCEMKDTKMITKVERFINDTINDKIELWGRWHSEGSIKGEYGCNHIEKCRYATVEEINDEDCRQSFISKGRKPWEFHKGDVVSDDVYALTVMNQKDNLVTVAIINSNRMYQVVAKSLEPIFFKEDRTV